MRILEAMEGQDAKNTRIQQADLVIDTATWDRDRPNFSLADYCNRHLRANLELEELGSARDGATQVQRFLAGINNDTMRSLKGIVLDNPTSKNDLQHAVIKLTDLYNQSKPAAALGRGQRDNSGFGQDRNRNIGMQNRWDHSNKGRGCGGRAHAGRGFGRGTSWNRGSGSNRGRGRGRDQAGQDDYIPKDLLDKMTPQQRKFIFAGRDKLRADNRQNNTEADRQVGATSNNPHELPPHPSGMLNQPDGPPPSTAHSSTASNQFGQRNHRHLTQGSIQTGKRYIGRMLQIDDP